jgi:hypothetical protein
VKNQAEKFERLEKALNMILDVAGHSIDVEGDTRAASVQRVYDIATNAIFFGSCTWDGCMCGRIPRPL